MGSSAKGKVIVAARIENLFDVFATRQGQHSPDQVRCVSITNAQVATDSIMLGVPHSLIAHLGLLPHTMRKTRSVGGTISRQIYQAVRLTIQERDCSCDVMELPDDLPVLIGSVPLLQLDLVVDPHRQSLTGNPEHGGRLCLELFHASQPS